MRLGNIYAKRDWGFAPDYVRAMWMMLQHDKPDDYVVATGETHSVAEFAEAAFSSVGLDWKKYVKTDERLKRPMDVHQLCGDPRKISETLGWRPQVGFKELVAIMVKSDLEKWQRFINGEAFAWDAPNQTHNMDIMSRHVTKDAIREAGKKRVKKKKKSIIRRLLK